jgi:hypothetical protein
MRTWSGPAITAKVFIPLALAFIAGLVAVPIRDAFTAAWFFLVVLPAEGAAIWLFLNIGEIGPSSNGVLYRKWVRWHHIPSSEVSNVVRVFPCFAALVLNEHVRLFFLPDPDTRRLIRSLPAAVQSNDTTTQTADATPVPQKLTSLLRAGFSFLIGVVSGIAIWALRGFATHYDAKSTGLVLFVSRYLPLFVGVCVLYLTGLVIARRLKARELHLSLALIGLGIVYLSNVVLRLL